MISVSGFWRERVCLNVWIKVFYNRHRVMIARRVFILAYDGRLRSVQCYFINSRLFFSPYFLTSWLISNLQPLEISFNTISQIIKLLQIKKTLHAAEYLTYSSLMFFFLQGVYFYKLARFFYSMQSANLLYDIFVQLMNWTEIVLSYEISGKQKPIKPSAEVWFFKRL